MLDDWLTTNSPLGASWAVVLSYALIFLALGYIAVKLSRMDKAKVVYSIIVIVGFILFLKAVIGYDITGILWDMWLTFKTWLLGGATNG